MNFDFYFDYLSPYSYLAWCELRALKIEQVAQVNYYPVILSQLIYQYQAKGPSEIPPKRNYLFKDCLRKAYDRGFPLVVPKLLPFNSLYALRLSLKEIAGADQYQLIDLFFRAVWEEGKDIGDTDQLAEILAGKASLIDQATSAQARRILKDNVQRAIEAGAFGLPTFVAQGELFWGHDSIDHLLRFMRGEDVVDALLVEEFKSRFNNDQI